MLTITAGSKREALDELAKMTAAMKAAFGQEGGGELYDIGNTPRALPVPNEQTILIRKACNWGALLILLGGLAFMANRLQRSGLSRRRCSRSSAVWLAVRFSFSGAPRLDTRPPGVPRGPGGCAHPSGAARGEMGGRSGAYHEIKGHGETPSVLRRRDKDDQHSLRRV